MADHSQNPDRADDVGRPAGSKKPAKPPLRRAAPLATPKPAAPAHAVPPVVTPQGKPAAAFDLGQLAAASAQKPQPVRRNIWSQPAVVIGGGLGLLCLVVAMILMSTSGSAPALAIKRISPQTVDELATLELDVPVDVPTGWEGKLAYSLRKAPEGAKIDSETGHFTWTPAEKQGPGDHTVIVRVASAESKDIHAEAKFVIQVNEVNQAPVVEPIEDQVVQPGEALTLSVKASDPDDPPRKLQYRLVEGVNAGARLDPQTGRFEWTPSGLPDGSVQRFVVRVEEGSRAGESAKRAFSVRLKAPAGPLDKLVAELRDRGAAVELSEEEMRTPLPDACRALKINGQKVGVFVYESEPEAKQTAQQVPAEAIARFGKTADGQPAARLFQGGATVAFYAGPDKAVRELLGACVGKPVALAVDENPFQPTEPVVAKPEELAKPDQPVKPDTPPATPGKHGDDQILAIYTDGKLFPRKEYPALRTIFAERFAAEQRDVIQQVVGSDKELEQWLAEHAPIREELYTAIDPVHDNVPRVLQLFRELKNQFPNQIVPYAELAIAVAVTWDDERKGVYDYAGHQQRTRSKLPEKGLLGALENFQYITTADKMTQAYGQFLPWEFLVHVVNHRTPLAERQWAVANYGARRMMFGGCYKDVPYDTEMLNSDGKKVKLEGKDYSLPNIRQFGGVCAMQADFAARVGKSMGIPAEYVHGESAGGELHAWVMWVELKGMPTKTNIPFSLESFGRYRGDLYYVGQLEDPQTGQQTTDRDLELRLQTVGLGAAAKRQADLIMTAYPMLREKTEMDVTDQLVFLNKVIELCPGNEAAWIAISKMSREGVVTKAHNKAMQVTLKKLFTTFAKLPDFTWKVFDDLVAYMDVPKQRNKLYHELVMLYIGAGRPDLACEAILKYTDYLVQDKQPNDAINILSTAIMKFPGEGRYVPRLLDKLEAVHRDAQGGQKELLGFYRQYLPMVPKMRGDRVSPFWIKMYQRGVERFRKGGDEATARMLEGELAKLQKGNG